MTAATKLETLSNVVAVDASGEAPPKSEVKISTAPDEPAEPAGGAMEAAMVVPIDVCVPPNVFVLINAGLPPPVDAAVVEPPIDPDVVLVAVSLPPPELPPPPPTVVPAATPGIFADALVWADAEKEAKAKIKNANPLVTICKKLTKQLTLGRPNWFMVSLPGLVIHLEDLALSSITAESRCHDLRRRCYFFKRVFSCLSPVSF